MINQKAKLLVVEDEKAIREMLSMSLSKAGYEVLQASNVSTAKTLLECHSPDLLLLDWMLPDTSGIDFLISLRKDPDYENIAVIMLTAKVDEKDTLLGFQHGVDDYVSKPFSYHELIARIKAVLRRSKTSTTKEEYCVGKIKLNVSSQDVNVDQNQLKLGPTEYKLLLFFMDNEGRVFSRAQLIDNVWGINTYIEERAVDVSVRRLRKQLLKVGCDGYLQTVYGSGYRFQAE